MKKNQMNPLNCKPDINQAFSIGQQVSLTEDISVGGGIAHPYTFWLNRSKEIKAGSKGIICGLILDNESVR